MTALAFDDVDLALGAHPVLSRVRFEIEAGEFVGLFGANGAGKTTLLRAALGLVAPRHGRITVLGLPAERGNKAVGYMPQRRTTPAHDRLSGRDFVACVAEGTRWGLRPPSRLLQREVARVLERVGAERLARRPIASMSGGERQRLLLAQALLGEPRLLLLDEPLASLDPSHQASVVALIRELHQSLGVAVVFCAHDLNPLLGVMDRVLYLANRHATLGTLDEVVTGPALSRLYGSPIEVVRTGGRIFVLPQAMQAAEVAADA